jgi:prophage antirepressor-like protein
MIAEIVRQEEFEGSQLAVIEHGGEEWFPAEDIGKALGFADPRPSIMRIFNRNRDEFEGLSRVVKLTTRLKDAGLRPHRYTVFNAQACIKFGFFANTPRAKTFRHWASNFLAHGVKRLKEGVARLEAQHTADQAHIQALEEGVLRVGAGEFAQVVTAADIASAAQCVIQGCHEDIGRLQAPWTVVLKRRDLHQLRDLMATKDPRYNRMARRIIQDLLDGREPDFYQEFPEPDRHLLNRDNCFHSEAWKLLEEWSGAPTLDTDTKARLETAKNEIRYTALTVSLSQTFFEMVLKALRNYEGGLQEMPLSMKSLI